MKRKIYQNLLTWKNKTNRKPLIVQGARQVGKTYILRHFAENEYENYVYLNFEKHSSLMSIFAGDLDTREIISQLEILYDANIYPEKTLLIFDEVQENPSALNSLKYFCEEANQYHIIAAGSLLGVTLANDKGFPVGKVDFEYIFPLTLQEFLEAMGEERLLKYLDEISNPQPLSQPIHEKLLKRLKEYMFVGGMPEAVKTYIDSHDFRAVRRVHNFILQSYQLDFSKHAGSNAKVMKIMEIWDSVPNQLAKENKKFVFSDLKTNARAREYDESLYWLVAAGLILKVHQISSPKIPLKAYTEKSLFKIYLLDVGILGAVCNLSEKILIDGDKFFVEFKGALAENFVLQELIAHGYDAKYYWTSPGQAEVDFILNIDNAIYPLEVKSGASTRTKSLQSYQQKHAPKLLLRTTQNNLKLDANIFNCPLYMLAYLHKFV